MLPADTGLAVLAFGVLLLLAADLKQAAVNPVSERITKPPRRTSAVFAT
jgi:hypothetical protein